MENMTRIYPNIPLLNEFFPEISPESGTVYYYDSIGPLYIENEKFQKVKTLLSEFQVNREDAINDFCFLCYYFELIYFDMEAESYYSVELIPEIIKLKTFVNDHEVTEIRLYSDNKNGSSSFSIKKGYIIGKVTEALNAVIKSTTKEEFKEYPIKPGAKQHKKNVGSAAKKKLFSQLRKFLQSSNDEFDKLSEYDENYFAGNLFLLSGIIEPFEHKVKERAGYKSEKDYLAKRMEKFR